MRTTLAIPVERRIAGVEIFGVELFLRKPESFAETLVMHQLTLTEEADGVNDIGVIGKAEDVVIGRSCLLLRRHILMQVGDRVALGLEIRRCERHACRRIRVDRRGMVNEILVKAAFFDLLDGEVLGELADDR